MTTIRDVSRAADVSIATVSRVINNDTTYKMTDETRERVWQAIKDLNYIPRPRGARARSLDSMNDRDSELSKRSVRIGCVLSLTEKKYDDPYFLSILSGAEDRLKEKGYELAFSKTAPEMEESTVLTQILSEPVDALLLMAPLSDETYACVKAQVPAMVGIDTNRLDIDNIGYDRFGVSELAVSHLAAKGHRKIGFIGSAGHLGRIHNSQRYRGYYAALHALDIPFNPDWVIDCGWNDDICIREVMRLIDTRNYPTAFVVASDLMAMAAMSAFYDRGISVPNEVAVIGNSNIEVARYSNPPLTSIDVPAREMGSLAADLLLARLDGDCSSPKRILMPMTVIQRAST